MKISQTFETLTPESAELGEYEKRGFMYRSQEISFTGLVEYIKDGGYMHLSQSPGIDSRTWITSEPDHDRDYYEKGEETSYSLHLDKGQSDGVEYLWCLALNYVTSK